MNCLSKPVYIPQATEWKWLQYPMFYIILSAIGFVGKSLLFKQLLSQYNGSQLHKLMCSLFVILIIQSMFELSLYTQINPMDLSYAFWLLLGFYFCLFFAVSLLPFIALAMSNQRVSSALIYLTLTIIGAISILLIFTRLIIADARLIDTTSSITRIAGPYYALFQFVVIGFVLLTLVILITKSQHSNYFIRVRSRNLCLAFIPFTLFSIAVVTAMAFEVEINAVGTLPLIGLFYLAAMVHNLNQQRQPDYLVFIPFTRKSKILRSTLNQLVYVESNISTPRLEEQLIDYYLAQPGLKQKDIATLLDISEATLSRRKKQLTNKDKEAD